LTDKEKAKQMQKKAFAFHLSVNNKIGITSVNNQNFKIYFKATDFIFHFANTKVENKIFKIFTLKN
jgi:hypothetical protein